MVKIIKYGKIYPNEEGTITWEDMEIDCEGGCIVESAALAVEEYIKELETRLDELKKKHDQPKSLYPRLNLDNYYASTIMNSFKLL